MDRQLVYPGQIPLETDLLSTNKNGMVALSMLIQDLIGTGTQASGFTCIPTGVPSLAVQVTPGRMYSLQNIDGTAYSSIPADTTHQIVKQGILLDAVTLACPAPTTAGYSVNYLIEAAYQDSDTVPVTLPYYNASNPTQAYSGPANSGTSQATVRKGTVNLVAKVGIAAATGTQTTPAVDGGYVALFVVTVAYGAASVLAGNISTSSSFPTFLSFAQLAQSSNGAGADLVGGVGRVVGSIAALRALLKTGVGKAFALGYYAAGDGGGGQYYYDSTDTTSTDNGGTIIVASDGGRWKLVYNASSAVSVKQFGAKGDGVTDDSPAFTAALAWARDTTKLITVTNVATYYNLASTVSFPGHTANAVNATSINYGVRLLGLGGGGLSARPKIQGNIAGFLFNLGGSDLSHVTYSDTIEGLYLGNFSASASSGCVKLGYVWDCGLLDCRFGSAGVNVDLGAWTMSSRFNNVRQDGTGSVAGTATTVAYGQVGSYFTGAWAVTMHGGSIFNCQYGFRGYGDITQSGRMDIEHVNVIFNFIAEGPYVFDAHIEDFDCLFTNDQSVYPVGFATVGGSAGTGDCMFTYKGSFSTWRGVTSPVVIRPLTSGRQFINLDDTFNKGGPYTAHNLSGAWNAVTDMTNANAQPCVVSLKRTSPLPDFSTTGWKPNYGTARTNKFVVIDADRAETSGQYRLEAWHTRVQTEQVVRANFTLSSTVNQGIANGASYSQTVTVSGARPADFVRTSFMNNAGTGGLPNGIGWSASVTANDTVVVNFVNNSGGAATVFGTTYVFVDSHDQVTVD